MSYKLKNDSLVKNTEIWGAFKHAASNTVIYNKKKHNKTNQVKYEK